MIEMFGEEGSMYWIEYKLSVCLGSYSRPHIIGIKAGWFGLVWFGLSLQGTENALTKN